MLLIKTSQGIINVAALIKGQLYDRPEPATESGELLRELPLTLELSLIGGASMRLKGEEAARFFKILEEQAEDATICRDLGATSFRTI